MNIDNEQSEQDYQIGDVFYNELLGNYTRHQIVDIKQATDTQNVLHPLYKLSGYSVWFPENKLRIDFLRECK